MLVMKTRYNLAQVIGSLQMGGAEKLLVSTVRELDKSKFNTFVCCSFATGDYGTLKRDVTKCNVPVTTFGPHNLCLLAPIVRLAAFLRKNNIHIVHTHLPESNIIGRLAAKLARVPVVVSTIHNIYIPDTTTSYKKRIKVGIERITANYCTEHLIAVSKAVVNSHIQYAHMDPEKFTVLPPFIMLSEFDSAVDGDSLRQKRNELGIPLDAPVIINVASLSPKKGLNYLLEAAGDIVTKFPNTRFLVVGDGSLREDLYKNAANRGISENVIFTGVRRDIRELLAISDLFASSSLWEGLPQVFLEAMAMGKPVVATAVGGVPEIVDNGNTGIVVPPKDAPALAQAIIGLLRDPERTRQMGTAGRERVEREYGANVVVRKLERLYESLIDSNSSRLRISN